MQDNTNFTTNLKKRTTEMDRLLTDLKNKLKNPESIDNPQNILFENVIDELKQKILLVERENRELKVNNENKICNEERKIFYLLNDLRRENINLEEENKNLKAKIIEITNDDDFNEKQMSKFKKTNNVVIESNDSCSNNNKVIENNKNEVYFNSLNNDNERYKTLNMDLQYNLDLLQNTLNIKDQEIKELNEKLTTLIKENECKNNELHEIVNNKQNEYLICNNTLIEQFEKNKILEDQIITKENMINTFKNQQEQLFDKITDVVNKISVLEQKFQEEVAQNKILNTKIFNLENEIIDLKGSIRVFCRIRPLENAKPCKYNFEINHNSIIVEKNKFIFNKIFDPNDDQEKIYKEVSYLIRSIFDGFNATIFAYGQTGSGKTFTMEGCDSNAGIIPRAINEIFEYKCNLENTGWNVMIKFEYVEIYNENINDLLSTKDIKIEIIHDENETIIKNSTSIFVKNSVDAMNILRGALNQRSVGYTKCNDRSSRSHSVLKMTIFLENNIKNEKRKGILTLIDLAGSERLSESGSEGIRLKETQNINKSLSSLGNVITSLLKKESHIPYRNSKLTYLLQNSLSNNSRVLMFVNISPELIHLNETLCSLRFAQKVSECKLGITNKNVSKRL